MQFTMDDDWRKDRILIAYPSQIMSNNLEFDRKVTAIKEQRLLKQLLKNF